MGYWEMVWIVFKVAMIVLLVVGGCVGGMVLLDRVFKYLLVRCGVWGDVFIGMVIFVGMVFATATIMWVTK